MSRTKKKVLNCEAGEGGRLSKAMEEEVGLERKEESWSVLLWRWSR